MSAPYYRSTARCPSGMTLPEEVATAADAPGVRTPPAIALSRFGVCVVGVRFGVFNTPLLPIAVSCRLEQHGRHPAVCICLHLAGYGMCLFGVARRAPLICRACRISGVRVVDATDLCDIP